MPAFYRQNHEKTSTSKFLEIGQNLLQNDTVKSIVSQTTSKKGARQLKGLKGKAIMVSSRDPLPV